ncbi:MAG: lipoprotein [Paludibacteraceae bacterium]|nr:lipoprotein [Paludibacteraceae bacterium]
MRKYIFLLLCIAVVTGCNKPSKVDQYHAEKHVRDSIALGEQERSMLFYQSQLDSLMPVVDSLLPLFKYEKNEKYQDHGFYVATGKNGLRVMVRDDGQQPILMYRNGVRVESADDPMVDRAEHLAVVMSDVKELEKRIQRTSLEIQKYQKRLNHE